MRPDRIIVGEVRGAEALDMLQAMNTGHDGSLSRSTPTAPRDALARIETMVLMAGIDLPDPGHPGAGGVGRRPDRPDQRLRDGTRRITQVTEVVGMEGDVITLQDIFRYDHSLGQPHRHRHPSGVHRAARGCRRGPAGVAVRRSGADVAMTKRILAFALGIVRR